MIYTDISGIEEESLEWLQEMEETYDLDDIFKALFWNDGNLEKAEEALARVYLKREIAAIGC